jgi:hypothetical protein
MARAGDGEAAHCGVDFWIADAEDAGRFREAVLADPAGATFSISQLTAGR